MTTQNRAVLPLVLTLLALVHATASAQYTLSYDPASPEAGPGDPADVEFRSFGCGTTVPWTAAALGIPAGGNLDAFSVGDDVFPILGPALGAPIFLAPTNLTQGFVLLEFSVDRATTGAGPIAAEAAPLTGDGAASDTFGVEMVFGPGGVFLMKDHVCVTPRPGETDIDALAWTRTTRYPVYFSVDRPTAAAMGVSPGDILTVAAPGAAPTVHFAAAALGLVDLPGVAGDDDVDAIAMMGPTALVYSVSSTSPTATAFPLVGSGGLFGPGTLPWAFAFMMGMAGGAGPDNLNALRIRDPGAIDPACPIAVPLGLNNGGHGADLGSSAPVLGQMWTLGVSGAPPAAPGVLFASSAAAPLAPMTIPGLGTVYLDFPSTFQAAAFTTSAAGAWSASVFLPPDPALLGVASIGQAAIFGAGGIEITNGVHWVIGDGGTTLPPAVITCNPSAAPTSTPLSDDSSSLENLGFAFKFFGATWTQAFVNSNGNLTFGGGSSDYTESVAELLGTLPRIAACWDDFNPAAGGTVRVLATPGQFEVCWNSVPEYGIGGSNTFRVVLANGSITMDYDGAMTAVDGLIGLSAGGGASSPGMVLDLDQAAAFIPVGQAAWELFTATHPNDVRGFRVTFNLDANGYPVSQN